MVIISGSREINHHTTAKPDTAQGGHFIDGLWILGPPRPTVASFSHLMANPLDPNGSRDRIMDDGEFFSVFKRRFISLGLVNHSPHRPLFIRQLRLRRRYQSQNGAYFGRDRQHRNGALSNGKRSIDRVEPIFRSWLALRLHRLRTGSYIPLGSFTRKLSSLSNNKCHRRKA